MSEPNTPDFSTMSNATKDFWFKERLFLGDTPIDIAQKIADLASTLGNYDLTASEINQAINLLDERQSETDETMAAHLQTRHIPDGGGNGQVIGLGTDGELTWLPQPTQVTIPQALLDHPNDKKKHLPDTAGLGGDRMLAAIDGLVRWIDLDTAVSADNLQNAFLEIAAKSWTLRGKPIGSTKIRSACFGADRFFFGGHNGTVNDTADGIHWGKMQQLFTDPVEGIACGVEANSGSVLLAINAYSDFRLSLDGGKTWCPRLSVLMSFDANNQPLDKYAIADVTDTIAGPDQFVIFTSSGNVLRATFSSVRSEYSRAMASHLYGCKSNVWQLQTSNIAVTAGLVKACFGNNHYVAAGTNGKICVSADAAFWETAISPFGASNVNDLAYGDKIFMAVGNDGKIARSTGDPRHWELIAARPFDNESILTITFGGTLWVATSASGKIATSTDGIEWTLRVSPLESAGRAAAYGDTVFLIGDDYGNIAASVSLSHLFSVVKYADFVMLRDDWAEWKTNGNAQLVQWLEDATQAAAALKAAVLEALASKPDIGSRTGLAIGITPPEPAEGEVRFAADQRHTHPADGLLLTEWAGVPTIKSKIQLNGEWIWNITRQGVAPLDENGKLPDEHATWMRDAADGIAALDENRRILRDYLPTNYEVDLLMNALRGGMVENWYVTANPIFEDVGGSSRIYGIDSTDGHIVAVGDKGRIAHGQSARGLEPVVSPFGEEPVIGVQFGVDSREMPVCVAISAGNSVAESRDGGKKWSELKRLEIDGVPADFEGLCFGARNFLIWCANGDVLGLHWDADGNISATKQASSPNITQGLYKIRWCVDKYIGVGVGGKIVTSINGTHWELETSFASVDLHDVVHCNGMNVAVGIAGTLGTSSDGKTWEKRDSRTKSDLYAVWHSFGMTIATGKDGVILSSFDTRSWERRTSPFQSILRTCHGYGQSFIVGSDAGQIGISATYMEILGIILDMDVIALSDEAPKALVDTADPGMRHDAARADHKHPDTGVVMEKRVGVPTTYKTVFDNESGEERRVVDHFGVAPLDEQAIVPAIHLPPMEVNIEQIIRYIADGGHLEFIEQPSCFPAGPLTSSRLLSGCEAFGKYFLCGERGIGVSETLSSWTLLGNQPFGNATVQGMAAGVDDLGNMLVVAIDTGNRYSLTRDGLNWSTAVSLGDCDFEDICYYNKTFAILCSDGPIWRSISGGGNIQWVQQASSPNVTERLNKIRGGNGVWVGVGNDGRIRVANDASHFEPVAGPTNADLLALCYGNGKFVCGGADGLLLSGVFGNDFEPATKPFATESDIVALHFEDGIFVATNRDGAIATSADLETWTEHAGPFVTAPRAACGGNGRIVLGDDQGKIAVSRTDIKVINVGGSGSGGGNVSIGQQVGVDPSSGRATAKLIDKHGLATGKTVTDIMMLRPKAMPNALPIAAATSTGSPQSAGGGWTPFSADEQLNIASKDNPFNEVEVV